MRIGPWERDGDATVTSELPLDTFVYYVGGTAICSNHKDGGWDFLEKMCNAHNLFTCLFNMHWTLVIFEESDEQFYNCLAFNLPGNVLIQIRCPPVVIDFCCSRLTKMYSILLFLLLPLWWNCHCSNEMVDASLLQISLTWSHLLGKFFSFGLGVYFISWYLTISVSLHPWQRSCSILVTKFAHYKRCDWWFFSSTSIWAQQKDIIVFNPSQWSPIDLKYKIYKSICSNTCISKVSPWSKLCLKICHKQYLINNLDLFC